MREKKKKIISDSSLIIRETKIYSHNPVFDVTILAALSLYRDVSAAFCRKTPVLFSNKRF